MKTAPTFRAFYRLMDDLRCIRKDIVRTILGGAAVSPEDLLKLQEVRSLLQGLPVDAGGTFLFRKGEEFLPAELDYESASLEKDLAFLGLSEDRFAAFLFEFNRTRTATEKSEAADSVEDAVRYLSGKFFRTFITDRDGTINDYCGRYRSSIQPIHSAVFLSRFARTKTANPLVLTSAPLYDGGLLDVSVAPDGTFHYAGSNGFEYLSRSGTEGSFPLGREIREALDELNRRLVELLNLPEYEILPYTGSGIQKKTVMTVAAHQDIYGSIPDEVSESFVRAVHALIRNLDPGGRRFRINDNGLDLEIMCLLSGVREPSKGEGIRFLDRSLSLDLSAGPVLVCGDTEADLPMLEAAGISGGELYAVFVTADPGLRNDVTGICPQARFVPFPDALLLALNRLAPGA